MNYETIIKLINEDKPIAAATATFSLFDDIIKVNDEGNAFFVIEKLILEDKIPIEVLFAIATSTEYAETETLKKVRLKCINLAKDKLEKKYGIEKASEIIHRKYGF